MSSESSKIASSEQQQQDISLINGMCQKLNLKFEASALVKMYRYAGKSVSEVKKAIELMLLRHCEAGESDSGVYRPHGFLMRCLKEGWQQGFDIYYQPSSLPYFVSKNKLMDFVQGL